MINWSAVTYVVSIIIMVLGAFMLTALPFSIYYNTPDKSAIIYAALTTSSIGFAIWWLSRHTNKKIAKREGYLIVALSWLAISIFSTLPYLYSYTFSGITNAFFESVSGLTTTGASVINDIEAMPKGILFWRSLTQWIGGMGIIVLTVAMFPLLGIGGVELFTAEAPGPTSDKIHPRIKETAKRLWLIYVALTIVLTIILYFAGMNFYDAINHGLTTMATGGFSTKNTSIAHFSSPIIQYPIIIFMFIAGINYTIIYYSLKGNFKRVWRSDEFKAYLILILLLITYVTLSVHFSTPSTSFEQSFRDAAFQVISVVTTTGFASADYTAWSPNLTFLFFILLSVGGCAGSTSGGIKIIRHLAFLKNSMLEFKRILHPKAIIKMKIDGNIVDGKILTHILVFLMVYLFLFGIGTFAMTFVLADFEQPLITAMGAVATSLGNVGPAIGELGPTDNFAQVPAAGKWILTLLMLLGRLELFTILILFTPYFWRTN